MKGVILAGGTGSRLYPLTKVTNKHLLPVGRYPMIYHVLYKLLEIDVREILIVTGKEHIGHMVALLGSGRDIGAGITYRVQDEAGGVAHALALAEDFARSERLVVVLGDNVFEDSLKPFADHYGSQGKGARVLLKGVPDAARFGVAVVDKERVVRIDEKPHRPLSSYAVTGIYFYDSQVFDIISKLVPSARGELEITDVNNIYIEKGELEFDMLKGWWTDAGTYPSYCLANHLARNIELGVESLG